MYRSLVSIEAKHCPDNRDKIWHNIEMEDPTSYWEEPFDCI